MSLINGPKIVDLDGDGVITEEERLAAEAKHQEEVQKRVAAATGRLTKSKKFKDWVKGVYEAVDADKSGKLDVGEVYVAVLMLYLKINGICKGAVPPTREQVADLFYDHTHNEEEMTLEQYEKFCQVLCAHIGMRVGAQMCLQTLVAPALGLLALWLWTEFMERTMPEHFHWCEQHIPTPVVVTAVVGTVVSMIVPPMMKIIDGLIEKYGAPPPKPLSMMDKTKGRVTSIANNFNPFGQKKPIDLKNRRKENGKAKKHDEGSGWCCAGSR